VPSEFPRSPRILKGMLVAYQLLELLPTIIVFQYNSEQLSRSLQARTATGRGRGEPSWQITNERKGKRQSMRGRDP